MGMWILFLNTFIVFLLFFNQIDEILVYLLYLYSVYDRKNWLKTIKLAFINVILLRATPYTVFNSIFLGANVYGAVLSSQNIWEKKWNYYPRLKSWELIVDVFEDYTPVNDKTILETVMLRREDEKDGVAPWFFKTYPVAKTAGIF